MKKTTIKKEFQKLAIFDILPTHQDYLFTISILAHKVGMGVHVFCVEQNYNMFSKLPGADKYISEIKFHVYKKRSPKILYRMWKYLKSEDMILINNSLYDLPLRYHVLHILLFYIFKPIKSMILNTDRTKRWYKDDDEHYNIRSLIRLNIMKFTLKTFSGLTVNSMKDISYLKDKGYQPNICYIPWYLKERSDITNIAQEPSKVDILNFGVVGAIEEERRDYLRLLEIFNQLWESGRMEYSLELIGRPVGAYGETVIKICSQYQLKGYPITFYKKFINMDIFLNRVASINCLISPLNMKTYTLTQSTAAITEQIRFNKVAIMPRKYYVSDLSSSTLYYDKIDDIKKIIENEISDANKLSKYYDNAVSNAEKYTFHEYMANFTEFVRLITMESS
jgi:hypothetical protein